MARRKTPAKTAASTAARRRRKRPVRSRKTSGTGMNFWVPLFLIAVMISCLGFVLYIGYRNVSASEFFDVAKVETDGNRKVTDLKVEEIVMSKAFTSGVVNADLESIRKDVEKLTYVKHASVSKVLPDTIRVIVSERVPRAVVEVGKSHYLVDEDAKVLGKADPRSEDPLPPFILLGWEREASESARELNRRRIALYLKLAEDWKRYDLAKRVKAVDISNLREPRAVVVDSGHEVTISLGSGDFAEALQKGLETIAGRGDRIEYVLRPNDANPIIGYRNS